MRPFCSAPFPTPHSSSWSRPTCTSCSWRPALGRGGPGLRYPPEQAAARADRRGRHSRLCRRRRAHVALGELVLRRAPAGHRRAGDLRLFPPAAPHRRTRVGAISRQRRGRSGNASNDGGDKALSPSLCAADLRPARPSPYLRRVGVRDFTFEACSGFTRITARWIAQPPKAAFVTGLRSIRLPGQTACQLPDQTDNCLGGSFLH